LLLKITAIVHEDYALESTIVQENLTQFDQELGIQIQVEFVLLRTFEILSFKAVKFLNGEKTYVLLSQEIFRRFSSDVNVSAFLLDVWSVLPSMVVFVDEEGWTKVAVELSIRRSVVNSLEFYAMMMESLDASMEGGGKWVKINEMMHLRPKILAEVEGCGWRMSLWKDMFHSADLKLVQLSRFTEFQAECLLAKSQVRGFHVDKCNTPFSKQCNINIIIQSKSTNGALHCFSKFHKQKIY